MTLSTVIKEMDSHDFGARLGIANTMDAFLHLAQREPAVKELFALLGDTENAKFLVAHVGALLKDQEDVRYRNSLDTAIAIYVWALQSTHPAFANMIAASVLGTPRLWWARKLAMEVTHGPLIQFAEPTQINISGLLELKSDWIANSTQIKDVLIVSQPESKLLEGEIMDPSDIAKTGSTIHTRTVHVGGNSMVTNANSTTHQTILKDVTLP